MYFTELAERVEYGKYVGSAQVRAYDDRAYDDILYIYIYIYIYNMHKFLTKEPMPFRHTPLLMQLFVPLEQPDVGKEEVADGADVRL